MGNPGRRPVDAPLHVPAAAPLAPAHLNAVARAKWDELVPDLLTLGLLAKQDAALLAAYCSCYSRWVEAESKIAEAQAQGHLGVIVKTPNGYPVISPWLVISNKCVEQLHKLGMDFGFSPAARARVHAMAVQGSLFPGDDPMEAYLRANDQK